MDIRHIPGLDLSGFFIPGNNGLPDLYVHANDPADWVTMQIAARSPVEKPSVAAEAAAAAAETQAPDWLKRVDDIVTKRLDISSLAKGFALSIGGILLAVALIVLGAYQLTKD
jgi:hypothetical protein